MTHGALLSLLELGSPGNHLLSMYGKENLKIQLNCVLWKKVMVLKDMRVSKFFGEYNPICII